MINRAVVNPTGDAFLPRRRILFAASIGLLLSAVARARPRKVTLDLVFFSYLDRPILDICIGKTDIGVSNAYPYTGRGTRVGMTFLTGPHTVSWRLDGPLGTPRNGELVVSRNKPALENIPKEAKYLAVHVYPDDTAEFIFTQYFPGLSPRGEAFHAEWEKRQNGGQPSR